MFAHGSVPSLPKLLAIGLAAWLLLPRETWGQTPVQGQVPAALPPVLPLEAAVQKASVNGKYQTLLVRIEVPDDYSKSGAFHDYGWWNGIEWAGYADLPPGYWVYVYPHWYIWQDQVVVPQVQHK